MNAIEPSPIGHELLDDPGADPAVVRESLHHLARSNAWFGGTRAAIIGIRRLLAGSRPARLSLVDLGTGAGDLPLALTARLRRDGIRVTATGIDQHRAAAIMAGAAGVPTAVADAFRLPIADAAVDVVLISQVAHHFAPASIVQLAREATRVSRLGVVIADLTRSVAARVGFAAGSLVLGFDRVTRRDGLTSLARGFTRAGLAELLAGAGFEATVTTHLGARIVATWSPPR